MIVGLLEVVSMSKRTDFSILQDIGRRLEKKLKSVQKFCKELLATKLPATKGIETETEIVDVLTRNKNFRKASIARYF